MNRNKKVRYVINISEIVFILGFIVLVGIVIYFISKGMGSIDIKTDVSNSYSQDQANAIKAAADSTVGKINNIIAVSAIFFTVAVATISVFQYIKTRDIDRIKKELIKEVEKNNRLVRLKIAKSDKELDDIEKMYNKKFEVLEQNYISKTNKIEDMIIELEDKLKILDFKRVDLEIDTNYVQIQELMRKDAIPNNEVISHYEKIKNLCESYPNIKDNEFLAKIYIDFSGFYLFTFGEWCDYDYIKDMLEKAIKLTDNPIMESSAYKVLLKLQHIYCTGLDNEIYCLKKIVEENYYDRVNTLELAIALDKRNINGDVEECFELLKTILKVDGSIAKAEIINCKNTNCFSNLLNSHLSKDFNELIKLNN